MYDIVNGAMGFADAYSDIAMSAARARETAGI